jgi:hypothetical protein
LRVREARIVIAFASVHIPHYDVEDGKGNEIGDVCLRITTFTTPRRVTADIQHLCHRIGGLAEPIFARGRASSGFTDRQLLS